ncbi:MAG TPA: PAS domain S-box protein [Gammaproteobacteria bacterium]|nr:PAS domain S-box protein [Gammaproteobacteria bacterium]
MSNTDTRADGQAGDQADDRARSARDLEARYEGLIRAAVDGVILIDQRGLIEVFNPAAERIFGYAAADVRGCSITMLMPEADAARHDGHMETYHKTGVRHIIGIGRELLGRRRNGEVFPMDLSVGEVASSEGRKYVGFVRDLTQRKRMENIIRAREDELREVVDNVPIGIFTAELPGIIQAGNPALRRLLKYEASELAGMSFIHLLSGDDYRQLTSMVTDLTHGVGSERVAELRMRRRDDVVLDVSLHIGLVARADSTPLIVGMVIDRTEKVRSEEVARQAREHLAHVGRLTTLGEMASAIAHEINQPLTAIANHAQAARRLLSTPDVDIETVKEACTQIAEQALRAGQVVRRIRAFVTKRESHKEMANLNEIVRSVLELAAGDAREAGVRIELRLESPPPTVLVDSVQIQQVCLNLIRNAIDAMRETPRAARRLEIEGRVQDGQHLVSFDDRGPGVADLARDRLFHPFFTTKPDGMGMGLSISQSIVAAHGGALKYETNRHGGARFVIALPIVEA